MISLIAAIGKNGELGAQNKLLWHLPHDLRRFRELTNEHPIIMGRKTFESIGRPLPHRKNIILTRLPDYTQEGCFIAHSLSEALSLAGDDSEVFIIGGSEIYTLTLPHAHRMYLTYVDTEAPADAFFPSFTEEEWREVSSEHHPKDEEHPHSFTFKIFERI